jgi:hypothetical protein
MVNGKFRLLGLSALGRGALGPPGGRECLSLHRRKTATMSLGSNRQLPEFLFNKSL